MNNTVLVKVNIATIENGDAELLFNEVKEYLSNQPTEELYKAKKEKFINYLISKRLSQTSERFKVLEKICVEKGLFSMDTIHGRVIKDMYVAIRTVSNTFNLLIDAGIIKRANKTQRKQLFKTTYFELCH